MLTKVQEKKDNCTHYIPVKNKKRIKDKVFSSYNLLNSRMKENTPWCH